MTDMTPAWTPYADPNGLWFNTTDADASGQVLAGGTFEFDTTGAFGLTLLNAADGSVLRQDLWEPQPTDGVFWVKLSPDGAIAAAGGWQTMDSSTGTYVGRLRVIRVADGFVMLDQATGSRVNQIAMSADGRWLAAGCGATYSAAGQQIYLYELAGDTYTALGGFTSSANSIQTLAMSDDGKWIIAGLYGTPSVILFQNIDRMLVEYATWNIPSTSQAAGAEPEAFDTRRSVREHRAALKLRNALGSEPEAGSSGAYIKFVTITPDGSAMAAALSGTNGVAFFTRQNFISTKQPDWTFAPANITTSSNISIAADGSFMVLGSNGKTTIKGPSGEDLPAGAITRIDNQGMSGAQAWQTLVEYDPNPCNHMLAWGDNVLAFGTGEPKTGGLTEGRFYVLRSSDGAILGRYATSVMNWPFQMSADGQFAIGGSDDGHLYGFNARGNWDDAV